MIELLPSIVARLPAIERLCLRDHWWDDLGLVLKAFDELTKLKLSLADTTSGWRATETVVRPNAETSAGTAIIHESTTILPGSVLVGDVVIGPDSEIGPNCTIFGPTVLGPRTYIGPCAEVRRIFSMSDLTVSHYSYVGHSIVGRRVNLAAGFTVAVRNLTRETVHVKIGDSLVSTGHEHFGAIIADDFYCSINTSVMPGRVLSTPLIAPRPVLVA